MAAATVTRKRDLLSATGPSARAAAEIRPTVVNIVKLIAPMPLRSHHQHLWSFRRSHAWESRPQWSSPSLNKRWRCTAALIVAALNFSSRPYSEIPWQIA